MNIAQALERSRERDPDRAAIVFEGADPLLRRARRAASRVANALRELGVGRGDRVALFLPNIPAFAVAYLGTQKLGAIAVSLNSLLKRDEVRFILDDSRPKVVVTTAPQRANVPDDELAARPAVVIAEGEASGQRSALDALLERGRRIGARGRRRPATPGGDPLHLGHDRLSRRAPRCRTAT